MKFVIWTVYVLASGTFTELKEPVNFTSQESCQAYVVALPSGPNFSYVCWPKPPE